VGLHVDMAAYFPSIQAAVRQFCNNEISVTDLVTVLTHLFAYNCEIGANMLSNILNTYKNTCYFNHAMIYTS